MVCNDQVWKLCVDILNVLMLLKIENGLKLLQFISNCVDNVLGINKIDDYRQAVYNHLVLQDKAVVMFKV